MLGVTAGQYRGTRTLRAWAPGHIVAMGGGGFSMEPENPLLDRFVLGLARRRPARVCFVATAGGDADGSVARFYRAFAAYDCRPSDLAL